MNILIFTIGREINMTRVEKHFEAANKMVGSVSDIKMLNILIYELWANHLYPEYPLPGFVAPMKNNTLLILGSNPSFNKEGYGKQLEKSEHQEIKVLADSNEFHYFIFQKDTVPLVAEKEILKLISKVKCMDESIKKNGHVYTQRINSYGIEPTGLSIDQVAWSDMCCFRMNDQSDLNLFLRNHPFLKWATLLIALRVIELYHPKMILLPNSGAATKLHSILNMAGGSINFSEHFGTPVLNIGQISCPIFLSANLHSRNQLDKYSKARYSWHVKSVWETLSKTNH